MSVLLLAANRTFRLCQLGGILLLKMKTCWALALPFFAPFLLRKEEMDLSTVVVSGRSRKRRRGRGGQLDRGSLVVDQGRDCRIRGIDHKIRHRVSCWAHQGNESRIRITALLQPRAFRLHELLQADRKLDQRSSRRSLESAPINLAQMQQQRHQCRGKVRVSSAAESSPRLLECGEQLER